MQITIEQVYRSNKNKAGELLKDKNGKEFWKTAVRHKYHDQDIWSTAFDYDGENGWTSEWKEGQILREGEYTFKENEWNGQKQFIISRKRKQDLLEEALIDLQRRVEILEKQLDIKREVKEEGEVNPNDIPF